MTSIRAIGMKGFMFVLLLIIFYSCHNVIKSSNGNGKGMSGNGLFIYTYADNSLKSPDTLEESGLVTNVENYQGLNYQDYFSLLVFDSMKNSATNKKIETASIVYAKIKSIDGKDSLEYLNHAGITWQVVKRQRDVTMLYKNFSNWYQDFSEANNVLVGTNHSKRFKLLKNGKSISGVYPILYNKKRVLQFIKNRYDSSLANKNFNSIENMTDYIMDRESERTTD